MRRVLAITNNLRQASYRLRVEAIRQPLALAGIQLDVQVRPRSFFARRRLLRTAADYDAVILQRKLLDPTDVRLLRAGARRLYFDVDDAVMYHSRAVGPLERWQTARRFRAVARAADCVVAGNGYLAELFSGEGAKRVEILPTVVDAEHYRAKEHAATENPTLVWIGSRSTIGYVAQFAGVLREAANRAPGLRLVTIADEGMADAPIPTQHVEWSENGEAEGLLLGDIGIAPMPEDRWTLGKCGFKIIQYMAAGLAVIASPVGANREIVQAGVTGYLPASQGEWTEAISALASDPGRRAAMGAAGRARVEQHYSLDRAVEFWRKLLGPEQVR